MAKQSISKKELVHMIYEHEQRTFTAANTSATWVCGCFSAGGVLCLVVGLFAVNLKLIGIGCLFNAVSYAVNAYFSSRWVESRDRLAESIISTVTGNASSTPTKEKAVEPSKVDVAKAAKPESKAPEAKQAATPAKAVSAQPRKPMATPITAPSRKVRTEKRKPMATPVRKRSPRRVLGVTQGTGMAVRREPTISEVALKEPLVSQDNYDAFMNG